MAKKAPARPELEDLLSAGIPISIAIDLSLRLLSRPDLTPEQCWEYVTRSYSSRLQ